MGNLVVRTQLYLAFISEALLNLFDCCINPQLFDALMDFTIRNWAHQSAKLKVILEKHDDQRISAVYYLCLRFGFSQTQSDTRAHGVLHTNWLHSDDGKEKSSSTYKKCSSVC